MNSYSGDFCLHDKKDHGKSRPSYPERKEGGGPVVSALELGSTGFFRERHDCRGQKSELGAVTISPAGGVGRWPKEFTQGPGQKVDGEHETKALEK